MNYGKTKEQHNSTGGKCADRGIDEKLKEVVSWSESGFRFDYFYRHSNVHR